MCLTTNTVAAVLAPRGDFDNSALGTGPSDSARRRRGVPLQPRCAALLGAAEALRRSPAHGLAGTTERLDDERCEPLVAARRAVASCAVGSRRGAGGRRVRRLCGAEQRSAAGAVRRAAPDRREVFMGRPRPGAGAEGIAAAPRSEQRRGAGPKGRPPQRSGKRRPPAPLRARSSIDGRMLTITPPLPAPPAPPRGPARSAPPSVR